MTRFPYSIPFSLPELPRRRQRLSVPPEPFACDGSPKFFLALSVKLSADDGMIIACFCRLVKQQSRSFGERRHFQEDIDCIIPENFPYVLEMSHSFCYNHVMTEQGRAYLIRRGARGCPKAYAVRLRMRRCIRQIKTFVFVGSIPTREPVSLPGVVNRKCLLSITAPIMSARTKKPIGMEISRHGVRAAPALAGSRSGAACPAPAGIPYAGKACQTLRSVRCAACSTAGPPHFIGRSFRQFPGFPRKGGSYAYDHS